MILFIVLSSSSVYSQNVSAEDRKALSEVLSQIADAHDVKFNYNSTLLEGLKVKVYPYDIPLSNLLDSVLQSTNLSYAYLSEKHLALVENETNGKILCGYLFDNHSKEPLAFVDVRTASESVLSDEQGYFEFKISKAESTISCHYLGYESYDISVNNKSLRSCLTYFLNRSTIQLETVIVKEYIDDGISLSNNTNKVSIDLQKVQMLPGGVEPDPLTTLLFLPGISSFNESLQEISVRGGTSDQNLLLWDDIPVFEASHLFGSVSGLNPHAIQEVDVYRNGVSSRYGGRVSGVIDIKSKDYIPRATNINIGTNMMHAHMGIEVPIGKRSALFLNGRFSLTNFWSSPPFISYAERVFQDSKVDVSLLDEAENAVRYSDVNFKWIYQGKKNKFTISGLGSGNEVEYNTVFEGGLLYLLDELDLNHGGMKVGWERNWNKKLSSEVVLTSTTFDNKYGLSLRRFTPPDTLLGFGNLTNTLVEGVLRTGLKWKVSDSRVFRLGMQYTNDQIDLDFTRRENNILTKDADRFSNRLLSFYGEYSMEIEKILSLDMGLRLNNSQELNRSFVEPRISVVTELSPNLKLKLSTSKNFQFISQLVVFDRNELGISNQTWVAANDSIVPVIEANQWTVGLLYTKDSWTVDVDAYVKEINGITSYINNFATNNVPYTIGRARIKGLNLLVKKRWGKYRSWISYTWSDIDYEFRQLSDDLFPASHHHTHNLRWAHLYKVGKFDFSLGIQLRSGLPYTPATGVTNNRIQYGAINSERLDSYFRLDGSIVYHFIKKSNTRGDLTFSFQNVSDARNVLSREYFKIGPNQEVLRTADRIGLGFTPNIGVSFHF